MAWDGCGAGSGFEGSGSGTASADTGAGPLGSSGLTAGTCASGAGGSSAAKTVKSIASKVANVLRGKTKPTFTPHVDTGDFVVIINAAEVKVTGAKAEDKKYHRHTGRPGSLRSETFRDVIVRRPEVPIEMAVRGMLPKTKLGEAMWRKLKVYANDKHPHGSQKPTEKKIKSRSEVA